MKILSNKYKAVYMRKWRKTHPLTPEQKRKDICRSYAGVYLRRGLLIKESCKECGNKKSEMHHNDYTRPLLVDWLCKPCHQIETNKSNCFTTNI